MLNHSHHEVIRGLDVLHRLSLDAVDAVHHDMVGRPRIKVSVPIIVGALIDVANSFDHLVFKALLIIPLPIRNLEAHREGGCQTVLRIGQEGSLCREEGVGYFVTQLAPVSVFFSVAVEHRGVTRDGYNCYGRSTSPVARLQFIETRD